MKLIYIRMAVNIISKNNVDTNINIGRNYPYFQIAIDDVHRQNKIYYSAV